MLFINKLSLQHCYMYCRSLQTYLNTFCLVEMLQQRTATVIMQTLDSALSITVCLDTKPTGSTQRCQTTHTEDAQHNVIQTQASGANVSR